MNAPSLWYVVGILGALATSWWISELYQRHCPFSGTEGRKWHGAGIFNLALFAQWSLLLAFAGRGRPDNWVMWARRCRIPEFVELQKKVMRHKDHILNTIRMRISNARVESINNKIKLIIRRSFGFRNIKNMMDLILLICSDLKIQLPNRPQAQYT